MQRDTNSILRAFFVFFVFFRLRQGFGGPP
jgi:hypothetical protein